MFVDYRGTVLGLLGWQWRVVSVLVLLASVVVLANHFVAMDTLKLPALPIGIVGGAIGIFVSFRTNSAYARWWEGRILWGRLINVSRHFATQCLVYIEPRRRELAEQLVRRHVAYVHVLRCMLRLQDPLKDGDALAFLSADERAALRGDSNMTYALLEMQHRALVGEADGGRLDPYRLQSLDESLRVILDVQGGCERIKKTPMPRGYAFIAERLIYLMAIVMPLSLIDDLGWWSIPTTVVVCLGFFLISEVGRVLEDPFTLFWPALPLYAMSKTIEVNLRERLGDEDLPEIPKPVRGVLM